MKKLFAVVMSVLLAGYMLVACGTAATPETIVVRETVVVTHVVPVIQTQIVEVEKRIEVEVLKDLPPVTIPSDVPVTLFNTVSYRDKRVSTEPMTLTDGTWTHVNTVTFINGTDDSDGVNHSNSLQFKLGTKGEDFQWLCTFVKGRQDQPVGRFWLYYNGTLHDIVTDSHAVFQGKADGPGGTILAEQYVEAYLDKTDLSLYYRVLPGKPAWWDNPALASTLAPMPFVTPIPTSP